MKIFLTVLFLLATSSAYAQYQLPGWGTIDTVTAGNFDDLDPQLDHGGLGTRWFFSPPFEWLVFERSDSGNDMICAMKGSPATNSATPSIKWDSSVTIISGTDGITRRKNPDICTDFFRDTVTLAAWMENEPWLETAFEVWDVYYNFTSGDETQRSSPKKLATVGISGGGVKVRPLSDSSFIVIWRISNALMFSIFSNDQMSNPDTLVVSDFDSTEFDLEVPDFYPNHPALAWTSLDSSGKTVCFIAQIMSLDPVVLSQLDTVRSDGNISDPKFIEYFPLSMMFNVDRDGKIKAVFATNFFNYPEGPISQYDLTTDSTSNSLGAEGVTDFPIIINNLNKPTSAANIIPGLELYAWERWSNSDTTLVFANHYLADTVSSIGYNRNLSFSSFSLQNNFYMVYPCVWESNRTGKSHIYSRIGIMGGDAVNEPPHTANGFTLNQNYPNPFNPTTVISYQLSAISHVTLKVYDILGRLVTKLVDAKQTPGEHQVTFDAKRLASGFTFTS